MTIPSWNSEDMRKARSEWNLNRYEAKIDREAFSGPRSKWKTAGEAFGVMAVIGVTVWVAVDLSTPDEGAF